MDKPLMKKRMRIMLILAAIVFGGIFIYKGVMGAIFRHAMSHQKQVITVSTTKVRNAPWAYILKAVGSLRAIKGVDVTTELAGMVQTIYFTPGASVKTGSVLVQLNAKADNATLEALQASTTLARITLTRDTAQYAIHAISKATLDADAANLKNLQAQTAAQAATVAKKTIIAPFTGRLGISAVNPGQYINPGDKIVTLQQLDPIYVDFYAPQQALAQLKTGQPVTIVVDTFPQKSFQGKITTLNPALDVSTRNVEVEATILNPQGLLLPGMFAKVTVSLGSPANYLTVPTAAISFNPYGTVVYLVNRDMTVTQKIVTTGREEGDRTAILKGLSENDEVVTGGQLKLKNGSMVAINNSVQPANTATPTVKNEH